MSFSLNRTAKNVALVAGMFAASALASCEKTKVGPDDTGKNPGNGKGEPKEMVKYYDYVFLDGQSFNDSSVASVGFYFGESGSPSQTRDSYIPWSGYGYQNFVEFKGTDPLIEEGDEPIDGGEVTFYMANANDVFEGIREDGTKIIYKPAEGAKLKIGQVRTSSNELSMNCANGKALGIKGKECKMGI